MAVAFQELDGSPDEDYSSDGITMVRRFICPWDERRLFKTEFLGNKFLFGGEGPSQYPKHDGVYAVRVRMQRFHDDILPQVLDNHETDLQGYRNYALVTATYEFLNSYPDIEPDGGFLTYRVDTSMKNYVFPSRALEWGAADPAQEHDRTIVKRHPIIEHRLTWHACRQPPWVTIRRSIGHLNNAIFLGAQVHTLLFESPSLEVEYVVDSELNVLTPTWRLEYLFRELAIWDGAGNLVGGWNYEYRTVPAGARGWFPIMVAGQLLYPSIAFAPLLNFYIVPP